MCEWRWVTLTKHLSTFKLRLARALGGRLCESASVMLKELKVCGHRWGYYRALCNRSHWITLPSFLSDSAAHGHAYSGTVSMPRSRRTCCLAFYLVHHLTSLLEEQQTKRRQGSVLIKNHLSGSHIWEFVFGQIQNMFFLHFDFLVKKLKELVEADK